MPNAGPVMLPPKSLSYYMGRLNLRDGGATTKRVFLRAKKTYDQRVHKQWDTMERALGLQAGEPETRRLKYDMRLTATIPFALLNPDGSPQAQPAIDPATGQVPVDEKGQPQMQPVIEHRPVWAVLKECFGGEDGLSGKYMEQAKDAVVVGANVPASVRYDVQEAERA